MSNPELFRAVTQIIQLIVVVVSFTFIYKHAIKPRKRKYKGRHIPFRCCLPKGYIRVPIEMANMEGTWQEMSTREDKRAIVLNSSTTEFDLPAKRAWITDTNRPNGVITISDEREETINGNNFHLIETEQIFENQLACTLFAFCSNRKGHVEAQIGYRPSERDQAIKEFRELLASVKMPKEG